MGSYVSQWDFLERALGLRASLPLALACIFIYQNSKRSHFIGNMNKNSKQGWINTTFSKTDDTTYILLHTVHTQWSLWASDLNESNFGN